MKNEEKKEIKICGEGFVEVLHYGEESFPLDIEWEEFVGKDSFAFWQKKVRLFPMWGRICGEG